MTSKPATLSKIFFSFCLLSIMAVQSCKELKKNDAVASAVNKKVSNSLNDTAKRFLNYYTFNRELDTEQNIHDGWVDTFVIDNCRFRASCNSAEGLTIEYYKAGTWHINFQGDIYNLRHFGLADVNKDGYNDLVVTHKYGLSVNFFQSAANVFDTITWSMLPVDGLLDSTKLIYYDLYGDNMTPMTSELYTFKNTRPYYYYVLRLAHANHDSANFVDSFFGLWKCKNGDCDIDSVTLVKKIKYNEGTEQDGYDYAKFWAQNYKRLIKQYHK